MQRNKLLTIVVLGLALFLGSISAAHAGYDDYFTGPLRRFKLAEPPAMLPSTVFYDSAGKAVTLDAFKGRVVLMMVWATWCPYCRHDLPAINALHQEMASRGLSVVAVATDKEGAEKVGPFLAEKKYSFPMYTDQHGAVATSYQLRGVPYFLVFDRRGREIGRIAGQTEWNSEEAKGFLRAVLSAK
jgi:thiol-disulfide isomerase/thioredoxin